MAQNFKVDSLKSALTKLGEDTIKVNALNDLAYMLFSSQPDEAIRYGLEAYELAEFLDYKKGLAYSLKNIGLGYFYKSDYIQVLDFSNRSLQIFEEINDIAGVSSLVNIIGAVYSTQGDNTNAIEYYLRSLRLAEEASDTLRIATALQNIGSVYMEIPEDQMLGLEYLSRALPLLEQLDNQNGLGAASANIGEVYYNQQEADSALLYFQIALDAYNKAGSADAAHALNMIGNVYRMREAYEPAIRYHNEAYNLAINKSNKIHMGASKLGLGNAYNSMNQYSVAIKNYRQAELLLEDLGANKDLEELYQGLSKAYAETDDFKNAFLTQTKLTKVNLALYNSENDKKLQRMQFAYDLEKKQGEIDDLQLEKAVQDLELQRQRVAMYGFSGGIIFILVIAFILYRNYRQKVRVNKILDKQNEEIENLLLNILPQEVARELQKDGYATPKFYEHVTVLFTDFKGFTSLAEGMQPHELLAQLNSFFNAFDDIIERHHVEKIKTIGDAYMCAGGIPIANSTHHIDVVEVGLAMQEYMALKNEQRRKKGEPVWELRVGIHTGPVVAGVVGRKKYAYDVWGNTVNVASRMESNSEPGKVNISASTYELIKDDYNCTHRGRIYAKNIGDIDMYFVERADNSEEDEFVRLLKSEG